MQRGGDDAWRCAGGALMCCLSCLSSRDGRRWAGATGRRRCDVGGALGDPFAGLRGVLEEDDVSAEDDGTCLHNIYLEAFSALFYPNVYALNGLHIQLASQSIWHVDVADYAEGLEEIKIRAAAVPELVGNLVVDGRLG